MRRRWRIGRDVAAAVAAAATAALLAITIKWPKEAVAGTRARNKRPFG